MTLPPKQVLLRHFLRHIGYPQVSCGFVSDSWAFCFKLSYKFLSCCALYRVDFSKLHNRLSMYAHDESMFPVIAAMEMEKLDKAKVSLPPRTDADLTKYKPCHNSQALLAKYHPLILQQYTPISVYGDGNCLFRSVSVCLYRSEMHHEELRAHKLVYCNNFYCGLVTGRTVTRNWK